MPRSSVSPNSVTCGTRPRDGFSVASPQHAAGYRSEPVVSPPCASEVMPDATAAAEPPLDPPGLRVRSHGLCVGPNAGGSVVMPDDISGVFVLPTKMNPARVSRSAISLVRGERYPRSRSTCVPR